MDEWNKAVNNLCMNSKNHSSKNMLTNFRFFAAEMFILVKSPPFVLLTVVGNSLIGVFSYVFYAFESEVNPKIIGFIDALWWGFATATTTGYGDITPVTTQGKVLGIVLMLTGMALFGMFTALFAETILSSSRKQKA